MPIRFAIEIIHILDGQRLPRVQNVARSAYVPIRAAGRRLPALVQIVSFGDAL